MGRIHARRPRRALAAAAVFGMVAGSLATMGSAHAAVMLSGSTIDSTGNYVDGAVTVYSAAGTFLGSYPATGGAFDIPLENGTYKLEFRPATGEFADEYYRDKADLGTADVVTVAGAAQTLPAWTIDRTPSVVGVVRTSDGRPVDGADITAYDASSGRVVASAETNRSGAFSLGTTATAVKLEFSGYDSRTRKSLATEFYNDKTDKASAEAVVPSTAGTNLGVVTLAPGGSISGRVTSDAGAPLYRVKVCASYNTCDYTNTSGAYTIEGVQTGTHSVQFRDSVEEYVDEFWNNVAPTGTPTTVTVAPGQAVNGIDAALAPKPSATPNGVDVSGTVRDELGGVGIGYTVLAYDTPADPQDRKVVAETVSNRAGQYHFAQLDRIAGETEFKLVVAGGATEWSETPREEGEFARRTVWSGNRLGYDSATVVTAAPRVLDFVQPVAGGIAGTVTSAAGGVPEFPWVQLRDADNGFVRESSDFALDGSYDERTLWAGTYTVQLGAFHHVSEWWKDALPEGATTITVKPGQMATGISAVLAKDVKAVERPEVRGDAWVGKTLRLTPGRWNTQAGSKLDYEWLADSVVVGTGPSLTLAKSHLGKRVVGRVTNDAGFSIGQAVTAATAKVGYKPKLKAKVAGKVISLALKAKPVKTKKVKAKVVAYLVKGKKANGKPKLKKLGKAKVKKGEGVLRLEKALGKGKHKLVFRIKGKGKVGSGDLTKKIKVKR